jgi:hypothetical protein
VFDVLWLTGIDTEYRSAHQLGARGNVVNCGTVRHCQLTAHTSRDLPKYQPLGINHVRLMALAHPWRVHQLRDPEISTWNIICRDAVLIVLMPTTEFTNDAR